MTGRRPPPLFGLSWENKLPIASERQRLTLGRPPPCVPSLNSRVFHPTPPVSGASLYSAFHCRSVPELSSLLTSPVGYFESPSPPSTGSTLSSLWRYLPCLTIPLLGVPSSDISSPLAPFFPSALLSPRWSHPSFWWYQSSFTKSCSLPRGYRPGHTRAWIPAEVD